MGNMEGPLGNATLHWWKSSRWIVIRIEALAVVAIIISFLLAIFGSCRRRSNRWIIQKGFFVAQVLSLSLGTYSIGLMQSSSVKSEMYPVWTVSLFTLFGCIDPVTTYNGLDYKGALSKVVYGICLNYGYVLLMSISTISNVVGNKAIITLSAITFIKGFHRSFALVQQNRMRDMMYTLSNHHETGGNFIKDGPRSIIADPITNAGLPDIRESIMVKNKDERLRSCYDLCVALSLSYELQCHILGLDCHVPSPGTLKDNDYEWALKVIEIELAFLYDVFFTGNAFLHFYQAKAASLWALASLAGICFVLVAAAIPGGMTRRSSASGCTKVVDTTATDLAITIGILVSLALLQLTQLVQSWTSNWARAAIVWAYSMKFQDEQFMERLGLGHSRSSYKLSGWMRLKALVATSTNVFDKYLWQDKISQYSILPEPRLWTGGKREGFQRSINGGKIGPITTKGEWVRRRCVHLVETLGLHYIWQVIWELLSSDNNKRGGIKLDEDVKASITEFLDQIQSDRLDNNWLSSLPEEAEIRHFLPHFSDPRLLTPEEHCYRYTSCVMTWHIATWYCELAAEQKKRQEDALMSKQAEENGASYCFQRRAAAGGGGAEGGPKTRDHRHVANALSQYCVYLVKCAPELLPGPVAWTKRVYDRFEQETNSIGIRERNKDTILTNMECYIECSDWKANHIDGSTPFYYRIPNGEALANLLMRHRSDELWKTLALVWVQLLVYAAPYGNVEAHMRRLAQGGEFITHLWALLYHIDILEWKLQANLSKISTMEDAERVLAEDDHAVVAYLQYRYDSDHDEVATASRMVDGVRYYYTSDELIYEHLFGKTRYNLPDLVFLKKEANNHKPTFYEGDFRAYGIARFVENNIVTLAHDQAQAQSSKDNGGQSEARIEEEIQPLP